jgi:hypothetical protein
VVSRAAGAPLKKHLARVGPISDDLPSDERIEAIVRDWTDHNPKPPTAHKQKTKAGKHDAYVWSVMQARNELRTRCLIDDEFRREELVRCADDVVYWLTHYGWTYDPRGVLTKSPTMLPFVPFDRQQEYLRWLEEREKNIEDGIADKSREVGFTWLTIAFMVHRLLFRPGWKGAVGSRKEDLVDVKGDPDSILEKARMLLRGLPHWMLPLGFDMNSHALHMKITNPVTGSMITGEAGKNIGRGGRNAFYLIDEAAFLENPKEVDAALSFNCPVKIYVSTPNGIGNPYYQKRHSPHYSTFSFHWRDDPRKDEAWYKRQCQKFEHDPVTIAQELDIDYTASQDGVMIPASWVQAAIDHVLGEGHGTLRRGGYDPAGGGSNEAVFQPRVGAKAGMPQKNTIRSTSKQAAWVDDLARSHKLSVLAFDTNGLGLGVASSLEDMGEADGTERTIHETGWTSAKLPYRVVPVQSGGRPGDELWPDGKTSKEKFLNVRAAGYWRLRRRFEKTYEHVNGIAEHPADERISIPNHQKLIGQLPTVIFQRTEAGKIKCMSKEVMRAKGVPSPDYGDALMLAFDEEATSGWHEYAAEMAAQVEQGNEVSG